MGNQSCCIPKSRNKHSSQRSAHDIKINIDSANQFRVQNNEKEQINNNQAPLELFPYLPYKLRLAHSANHQRNDKKDSFNIVQQQEIRFQDQGVGGMNKFETESIKRERQQEQIKRKYQKEDEQVRRNIKQKEQREKVQFQKIMQNLQAEDRRVRAQMINQLPEEDKFQKECQVCLAQLSLDNTGLLSCGHMFHIQCINAHIKTSIQGNFSQLKCPMEECGKQIKQQDIRQFTDQVLLRKYQQSSFRKFVQMNSAQVSWCPTVNCTAVFVYDRQISAYLCPICKFSYCLKCKCLFHKGMTCAEYKVTNTYSKEDRKFQQFAKGAKYKQCPSCKFWVEKNAGCNHMTCRCKYQFCYKCGKKYPQSCKAGC